MCDLYQLNSKTPHKRDFRKKRVLILLKAFSDADINRMAVHSKPLKLFCDILLIMREFNNGKAFDEIIADNIQHVDKMYIYHINASIYCTLENLANHVHLKERTLKRY